jgi:hypothetical protein
MIDPNQITAARQALGRRLATYRKAAGLSQHELAPLVHYGRSTIANVEVGRQNVPREFWVQCDRALAAGGQLLASADQLQTMLRHQREETALLDADTSGHQQAWATAWQWQTAEQPVGPALELTPELTVMAGGPAVAPQDHPAGSSRRRALAFPPGRYFSGTQLDAMACVADDDGRIVATVPAGLTHDPLLRRAGRGMLVCTVPGEDGDNRSYALDTRTARRRLARAAGTRLGVPRAYLLDELTFAVTWAVANLDESLLGDDALLEDTRRRLSSHGPSPAPSLGRDGSGGLSAVSRMWLGSDACARYILRHIQHLDGAPAFWTREQHGEEASTWLLFVHKYDYLDRLGDIYGPDAGLTRTFCIPPDAVADSPAFERTLLLLAAALMESFGVRIEICDDPEYAAVEGFVLDHGSHAIVANWVNADGIWQADVLDRRPALREYADILGHAATRSVTAAQAPAGRLQAFASYLNLDWTWLTRRSAELGEYGVAGLAEPRSRLLSTAGVDRACRYLGHLDLAVRP